MQITSTNQISYVIYHHQKKRSQQSIIHFNFSLKHKETLELYKSLSTQKIVETNQTQLPRYIKHKKHSTKKNIIIIKLPRYSTPTPPCIQTNNSRGSKGSKVVAIWDRRAVSTDSTATRLSDNVKTTPCSSWMETLSTRDSLNNSSTTYIDNSCGKFILVRGIDTSTAEKLDPNRGGWKVDSKLETCDL